MKKISFIVLCLMSIMIITGCGNQSNNKEKVDNEENNINDVIEKEEVYNNHTYDGIYSFLYTVDNGNGYMYTQKGYLKINNDKCETLDSTSISDTNNFKLNVTGSCKLENDIYKLELTKSKTGSESIYECKIDGKDLKCESKSTYGISGCVEANVDFKYFGTEEEYKEHKSKKDFYLSSDIRWGMSAQEVIKVIGTGEESSAPNFNKNLSWIKLSCYEYTGLLKDLDEYTYLFYDSQLVAYQYTFDDDISLPHDTYIKIKEILVEKYGNPKSEKYNWVDETYKNDKNNYNNALKYKDVTIETKWPFDGYELVITWNYDDVLRVAFVKNGYFKNL